MTNRTYYLLILFVLLAFLVSQAVEASPNAYIMNYGVRACTSSERWFTKPTPPLDAQAGNPTSDPIAAIPEQWILTFTKYLQGKISPIEGFSQALALRRLAANSHERIFSEYWVSRVLMASGMVHLAEGGFKSILQEDPSSKSIPFQIASLSCLNMIKRKTGVLNADANLVSLLSPLKSYADPLGVPEVLAPIWETAFHLVAAGSEFQNPEVFQALKGSGAYESLALGIFYSQQAISGHSPTESYTLVVQNLQNYFSHKSLPEALAVMRDQALLLMGRAWYSMGAYDKAILSYKKIGIRSNEWVHGLSELAWSYLMAGYYREAIGVGVGIQSGALKRTFSPETVMVMAMALNEMCYFPESLKMVNKFKKDYTSAYLWLKQEGLNTKKGLPSAGYKQVISYAKNTPVTAQDQIPGRVASEWIRSPIFLTEQDQINLTIREKATSSTLTEQAIREQGHLAREIAKELRELRNKFMAAKIRLKQDEQLPVEIQKRIQNVRLNLERYARIRNAAPTWRLMLANFESRAQTIAHHSAQKISTLITQLNERMLGQLEDIAENHELLEVEIFNGASDDIIWQNAHPDFKKVVSKMKASKNEPSAEKVWDWGSSLGGLDGRGEIWEDEVGSLSANLHDNCESKDKYLAIKNQFQSDTATQ
ncbi:MAG: hypothetical protein HYX41_01970 [Bdellovibrio sp.]|nr:hypothetical protein [Bdellovibrio sp.]